MVLTLSSLRNPYITHRFKHAKLAGYLVVGSVLISHSQVTFLLDSFASLSHAG